MRRFALVVVSALLLSCSSTWSNHAVEMDGHRVVWQPDWYEGYLLVAVAYIPLPDVVLPDNTVTSGRHALKVYVDNTRIYQRVETTSNVAGTNWMRHTVEWELVASLKPEQAATEDGWRDPTRRHRYLMHQFSDIVGANAIEIYGDGYKSYWITQIEYRPREVPVRGQRKKGPPIRSVAGGVTP